MKPKMEEKLRRVMFKFGNAIETLIKRAKKAKSNVSQKQGVSPILALEGQIPLEKMNEVLGLSIEKIVTPMIPNLVDKSSIEITDGEMRFSKLMKEKDSSITLHLDISKGAGSKNSAFREINTVKSREENLPFEDGFFDFVVANLATPGLSDIVKVIKEVGRIVTMGGRAILIDFHPFGRFAKKGRARFRSIESVIKGLEDYYRICESAGFKISYVKEGFFDDHVRSLFEGEEERALFRAIKNSPFLIYFDMKKGR